MPTEHMSSNFVPVTFLFFNIRVCSHVTDLTCILQEDLWRRSKTAVDVPLMYCGSACGLFPLSFNGAHPLLVLVESVEIVCMLVISTDD